MYDQIGLSISQQALDLSTLNQVVIGFPRRKQLKVFILLQPPHNKAAEETSSARDEYAPVWKVILIFHCCWRSQAKPFALHDALPISHGNPIIGLPWEIGRAHV